MRFGAILDHLEAIGDHLEKFEENRFSPHFGSFLIIFGHFDPIFVPHLDPIFAQSGEPVKMPPNRAQIGPKMGPKMRFGAILDHFEAIGDHLRPFWKSLKNFDFDPMLDVFRLLLSAS